MIEDFFRPTLPATVLRPYIGAVEQRVLSLCTIIDFVVIIIYLSEFVIYGQYHWMVYLFIMAMRLDSSESLRKGVREGAEVISSMLAILGMDGGKVRTDVAILIPPPHKTKPRIASLNFELIQIVNDM